MLRIGFPRAWIKFLVRSSVAALLLLVTVCAAGDFEDWDFQYLKTPNGEWVNEIVAVVVDHEGTVWAATWGEGLHRIRGTAWDNFREESGFIGDWQRCLVEDDFGSMWVGTADGICRFTGDVQTDFTVENTPSLANHSARTMLITSTGDLIIGTSEGYVYRCARDQLTAPHPDTWELLLRPEGAGDHIVVDLVESEDNHLFVSLKFRGVLEFDGSDWHRVVEVPLGGNYVLGKKRIAGENSDVILAAHAYGSAPLHRRVNDTWTTMEELGAGIYCLSEGPDGSWYAGTEQGLFQYDDAGWHLLDLGQDVGEPNIRTMYFSNDSVIWLGTDEGLIRGTPRSWALESQKVISESTRGLIKGPAEDGRLLALTNDYSVYEFQEDTWNFLIKLDALAGLEVSGWTTVVEGKFWVIGSSRECFQVSVEDGTLIGHVQRPEVFEGQAEPRMSIYQNDSGELYMYGDAGVFRLSGTAWERLPNEGPAYTWQGIDALEQLNGGPLYFAGDGGIAAWENNVITDLGSYTGLVPEDSCHALCILESGEVWFGTFGSGIYVVSGKSATQINRKNGLRSDAISQLLAGHDGSVWVVYRRQGIGVFRDGHWLNFGTDHGLPNTAIAQLVESKEGILWARTEGGALYRYRPDTEPPETRIIAGPEQVDAHGIGSFSFDGWDAWDHSSRMELKYTTRIISRDGGGTETGWSGLEANTTRVSPDLSAGNYLFEVRASDEDGNLDQTPASRAFTVLPPFWQRPPFYLPLLLIGMVSLFSLFSWYRYFLRLQLSQGALKQANLSLLKEIEERDHAEAALKNSESHLEQAQVLAKLGSWDLSATTQVGTWSKEMFSLFNRDPALGTPSFNEFIKLVHPEDRKTFINRHRELFHTGEPFEMVFRTNPDLGPMQYFHNRVNGLRDEHGRVIRFSGATQDVTAQKRTEAERIDLEEKLRQSQKLEAIGQLVGGIAHDFNNILHALLGYCQVARDAEGKNHALVSECLAGIETAGNRAADLVRQLLTFSRREKMNRKVLRLEPIIDETLALLRRTLPSTIELRWDSARPCHPVYADPTQMQQIILNLCTNGWQAMESTGGTLELDLMDIKLTQSLMMNTGKIGPGDYVRLSVGDSGPGINADVIQNIFDPFFTTKGVGAGTGLGLATVHGIALSLGGGVVVESCPGAGATFHVYLKQAEEAETAASEADAPVPKSNDKKVGRILLVDDETSIVQLTSRTLTDRGYDVDAFDDAAMALEAFQKEPDAFSIVVTDFTMPKLTGVALAAAIRAKNPGIPILMLSGHLENGLTTTAHITEVLQKPISMHALAEAIERNLPAET